jgi:sugar lactone lactonase YvrE
MMRCTKFLCPFVLFAGWGLSAQDVLATYAGHAPYIPPGIQATAASLGTVNGVVLDNSGALVFSDSAHNQVFKVSSGVLAAVAGTGQQGFSGDSGPATNAELHGPGGLAFDTAGNLFIADFGNQRVRKVDTSGNISTVAGTGTQGFFGDGGPATNANLNSPNGLAVIAGTLYIADSGNNVIRALAPNGTISTVVSLNYPLDLAAASGILYATSGYGVYSIRNNMAQLLTSGLHAYSSDGTPASQVGFVYPTGIWVDGSGAIFVSDFYSCTVRKITTVVSTVAGTGANCGSIYSYGGDNGPAAAALLNSPTALTGDSSGDLWIADSQNYRIREVTSGTISTVVGGGFASYYGDGIAATDALLSQPLSLVPSMGMLFDSQGNLYLADTYNKAIRKITPGGIISTVVKPGAGLQAPTYLAMDSKGALYVSDGVIYKVNPNGTLKVYAGGGTDSVDEGIPATQAQLRGAAGIAFDAYDDLFIVESSLSQIRAVTPDGFIYTIFASEESFAYFIGLAVGDELNNPTAITFDSAGNLYVAEEGPQIQQIHPDGTFSILVGNGGSAWKSCPEAPGLPVPLYDLHLDSKGYLYAAYGGCIERIGPNGSVAIMAGGGRLTAADGLPAVTATLGIHSVTLDSSDNLYAAGQGKIWKIAQNQGCYYSSSPPAISAPASSSNGSVSVMAGSTCPWTASSTVNWITVPGTTSVGSGSAGYSVASNPSLCARSGTLAVAGQGVSVSQASSAGSPDILETIAGTGKLGSTGDGGQATSATMNSPQAVAYDSAGNLYFADTGNNRIRQVTPAGIISTFAGNGNSAYSGDGGLAINAGLSARDVAFDSLGNLYVADNANGRIRRIAPNGTITTFAGNGNQGFSGDGGPATSASLLGPSALAFDSAGNLYFLDAGNGRIREVTPAGIISTIAGNGMQFDAGDGGLATNASFYEPQGVAVDPAGNVYVGGPRIRRIGTDGIINAFGGGTSGSGSCLDGAQVSSVQLGATSLRWLSDGSLYGTAYYQVYRIDGSGIVHLLAGAGTGFSGGPAVDALLYSPYSPVFDSSGNVVFADYNNERVRKIAKGVSCSFTLSPNQSFLSAGGSGTIAVTATTDCPWTPTTTSPFITLPLYNSGSGNGSATFTVGVNTTMSYRTGTINIGSAVFTVTQAPLPVGIVTVGSSSGVQGGTANIPLSLTINNGVSFDGLSIAVTFTPNGSSNPLAGPLSFTPATGMPAPTTLDASVLNQIAIVWAGLSPPLSGPRSIGTLTASLAANGDGDNYTVHVSSATGTNGSTPLLFASGTDGALTTPYKSYLVGDGNPFTGDRFGLFGDQVLNTLDLLVLLRAVTKVAAPAVHTDRWDALDVYPVDGANRGGDCVLNTLDLLEQLRRVAGVDTTRPRRLPQTSTCPVAEAQSLRPPAAGSLTPGEIEPSGNGWKVPIYIQLDRDVTIGGLAFSMRTAWTSVSWTAVGASSPTLQDNSVPSAFAIAWLDNLTVPAGDRVLLGYLSGVGPNSLPAIDGVTAHDTTLRPLTLHVRP